LHIRSIGKSLPQNVKEFIGKNIDLLPREIDARLVNEGLDISIRQKQIHKDDIDVVKMLLTLHAFGYRKIIITSFYRK